MMFNPLLVEECLWKYSNESWFSAAMNIEKVLPCVRRLDECEVFRRYGGRR